jgi:hypothetical protein
VSSGSCDFDRTLDVLLNVNLGEVIVDFTGNEIRLVGDRLERCFST